MIRLLMLLPFGTAVFTLLLGEGRMGNELRVQVIVISAIVLVFMGVLDFLRNREI